MDLHPLCTFFPRMTGTEFQALVDDIKANGLREPIILHDGMILDGGNRYAACMEAGVEPRFVRFSGGGLGVYVLSANLHRRHLTPGQQAAIVAGVQDWSKANAHGGDRRSDQAVTLPLDSVAGRMAHSGASDKTQRMADKVVKADPDLGKRVAHGEISLPKAVKQISPPKEKPHKKRQLDAPPPEMADYDPRDDELAEAHHTIIELAEEVTRLKDARAVAEIDDEDERQSAEEIIAELRREIVTLTAERDALVVSRNAYQTENGQLKQQLAMQRKEIKRLSRGA